MVKEFEVRDVSIKRIQVLELLVLCLVHYLHAEFLAEPIRRFVERTVIYIGFMFSFVLENFSYCCVLVNFFIVECNDWRNLISPV